MRSDRSIAGWVFAGALTLRLLHLQQVIANDPFYLRPTVDSLAYHDWASRLAAGDWIGNEAFFLSPLYGYGLGALFALTGPSHFWPLVVNALLGAGTCAVVYSLSCRLFGRAVALVAAALVTFYGMEIFYEGSALVETTQTFLTAAIALVAVRAMDEPTSPRFAALGGIVGLSILARENMLLFAVPFAACAFLALAGRLPARERAMRIAVFAAAMALCILPATLRNWLASGDVVLVNSTGGVVLYTGWNPDASGVYNVPAVFPRALADDPVEQKNAYRWLAEQRTGKAPLAASEVSRYWREEALAFIRAQPARALALGLWKARLFWSAFEAWDVRSYTLSRPTSWVLQLPLVSFGLLAPLALVGIALSLPHWRRLLPLYTILIAAFATAVLFIALSRYRMPAVPVLAVFAAFALVSAFELVRAQQLRRLASVTALLLVATLAVNWRVPREDLSMAHFNLGNAYSELGRYEPAVREYSAALAGAPTYLSTWNNLALAYEESGADRELAARAWQRLLALAREQGSAKHAQRAEQRLQALNAD